MRTALVCEDDVGIRRLIEVLLRQAGLEVESVGTGRDALDRIVSTDYSVVILDLVLPFISGQEIVAILAESHPEKLSRIIVTTAAMQQFRQSQALSRVAAVLMKPFDVDLLRETVRAIASRT